MRPSCTSRGPASSDGGLRASKPREPVATLPAGGIQVKRDAIGIDHVIVNGAVLLNNGVLTDALPGQIIRGPLYQGARA